MAQFNYCNHVRSRDLEFCSLIGPRLFYKMVETNKKEDGKKDDSLMVKPFRPYVQIIKCQLNLQTPIYHPKK